MEKERFTCLVDTELLNLIRNIVYFEPAFTMSDFAERALAKFAREYVEANTMPKQRPEKKLRSGRPLK